MARIVLDTAATLLGVGSAANDGTGNPLRTGALKIKQWAADINSMTSEIYADLPAEIQLVATPLAAGSLTVGGVTSLEENAIIFTTSKLDVNSQAGNQADAQRANWRLSFGQALFNVTDSADQVMALGYNVVGGGSRPNLSEIGLGLFFETDYVLAGTRLSEAYFAMVGGSVNNNNRPIFFQWNRVTGALIASVVHAAGALGATGFKVLRPTDGGAESGQLLHTFSRNTITVECEDTTANTLLVLKGGSTNRTGQITLGYGATTNAFTVVCSSAANAEIALNNAGAIVFYGNPGGSGAAGAMLLGRAPGDGGGALGNSQILGVDLTIAGSGIHGIRVKGKASGAGDLLRLQDSADVVQWSVTRAGLLTASTTQANNAGATTITPTWTNKPGGTTTGLPAFWVQVSNGTTTAWMPAWAN